MLILSRKPKQSIRIGDDVVVTITKVRGNSVSIGILAPKEVNVRRDEVDDNRKQTDDEPQPCG